jgi:hypothetical protein
MPDAVETEADHPGEIDGLMVTFAETEPSRFTAPFFQELCQTHSEGAAIQAALRYIARKEAEPAGRQIMDWLARGSIYLPILFDPDLLPLSEAKRATPICRQHDTRFLARVQQFLTDSGTSVRLVLHGLIVLDAFENDSTMVPLLRTLTHHGSERIRSQATKALCKLHPNRMLVQRQLRSHDARTRANAIEGLWGMKTTEAAEIFRMAASDLHHRVVVNAFIGLYYENDKTAFDQLIEIAGHRSPLYRAAAIWAFGQLEDPRAIPVLQTLLEDPRIFVRKKAAAVLERVQAKLAKTPPKGAKAAEPESPQAA